ncbi:MAG: hypothetical protein ACC634_08985, partial [Hyphomicrobiales bacterium]
MASDFDIGHKSGQYSEYGFAMARPRSVGSKLGRTLQAQDQETRGSAPNLRDSAGGKILFRLRSWTRTRIGFWLLPIVLAAVLLAVPIHASANIFTISGIEISATAKTSNEAKQLAIAEGQNKALASLFAKLVRVEDAENLPPIDDALLQQVVAGFSL